MKEILTDFLEFNPAGLYCKYGDFYIDPIKSVHRALISHAHGDHARPGSQLVYCTLPTKAFMECRFNKKAAVKFDVKNYQQRFFIVDIEIEFISAGHILGSAQILMSYRGVRYLYTGDYKIQEDSTCDPIDYTQADVLITEATFANPAVRHPDFKTEIQKLNATPYNILLGAYALGKAQRLNQLINMYCPEKTVLLHYSIMPLHGIYERFGTANLKYQPYSRKILKAHGSGYIYIVPALTFNSYFRAKNLVKAFASGWDYLQQNNDISLYISDHVDWEEILTYVKIVNPIEIWTLHGDGKALLDHFEGDIIVRILN